MKRIVFILAGGGSARMGGRDKAAALVGGKRLIDRVIDRLAPQADRLLISGPREFETGLGTALDISGAPEGPVGGIFSMKKWILEHEKETPGFFTAPVDGPFAPSDLVQRLGESGGASIASDGLRDHPTYAYWTCETLAAAWRAIAGRRSVSLTALADICKARRIIWEDRTAFFNINSKPDLEKANRILAAR